MKFCRQFFLASLVAGISWLAQAQSPLLTNRATEMRASPDDAAALIKKLPDKSPVQLLERKSAWSKVKSDKDTGWVRMMHLRGGAEVVESSSSSNSMFSGFTRFFVGDSTRSNPRSQSATVGIRGITEEDLKNADPNPAAFVAMKSYAMSEVQARAFAAQGRLQFRSVAYLAQDAADAATAAGVKK